MNWFRHLSPLPRSIVVMVAAAALTSVLGLGGLLAFFAWDDHQFRNGSYCRSNPADPLC